jgi:glycosyltransferase involved in cell wall biosynthesis
MESGSSGGRAPQAVPELTAHATAHLKILTGQGDLPCSAFVAFAHLQRLDRLEPDAVAHLRDDRAGVLDWYLTDFAAEHASMRPPLSEQDISFLLSDDTLSGLPFPIPRIVLWHALRPHSGAPQLYSTTERDLAQWWVSHKAPQMAVEDCLVPARYIDLLGLQQARASARPVTLAMPALVTQRPDVQVIGPMHQQSGLGRATRLSVETFRRAGLRVTATNFSYGFPSPALLDAEITAQNVPGPAPAAVIHLNPDMLPWLFAAGQGDIPARRAGYFFWELDRPATCDFLALDLVDEIWTASEFVKNVYLPFFNGIVDCVGLATPPILAPDRNASRSTLRSLAGLSPDSFVFLSVFDGFSYVERKNPLGAIRAFQSAFPSDRAVSLVIKTHNRPAAGTTGQGALWREIERICTTDPRIRVLDQTLAHEGVLSLVAGADAFVSLHRSEGWGLSVLESMQLGVPVIATAYSGTEDFCTEDTAWRVPYTLIPVQHGDYVHAEPHHHWADPDPDVAAWAMADLRGSSERCMSRSRAAQTLIASKLSLEAVGARYTQALERLLARA